jgi:EpsI family protein
MHGNQFLTSTPARLLTAVLLCQAAAFYIFARGEVIPQNVPLASVPQQLGSWALQEEGVVEKEIQDVLKADELLNRSYVSTAGVPVSAHLFVAYFKSQRSGRAPHSPRNCLPGSGWVPSVADLVHIPIPGRAPIEANRYVVQKGNIKSLVLYWYQSRDRVVANEYMAKFYVVADALRYNRTDTALVRVVVPIVNDDMAASEKIATDFVQSFFVPLRQHFPA